MKIVKNLVPSNKYNIKCPYFMTPTRIVIHNTANDASAQNEIAYMIRNDDQTSFHYAVDDQEAVQGIPEDRNAWHASDGLSGKGNREGIAIEICYSKSGGEKFKKAEENAVQLTASILKRYGWGIDRVTKHQDYGNHKYCPHRTLEEGWDSFLNRVSIALGSSNSSDGVPSTDVLKNDQVLQWQKVMNQVYRCNLALDGSFGPDSKAKANQYQLHYTVPTMKNEYVRFVQQRLKNLGYSLSIDGSFGPDMYKKVKQFQKDRSLKVDGWVGKDTVYELLKDSSIVSSSGNVLKNDRVLEWQKVMNQVYRCNLALDGSFGPDSKAKANQYQLHYTVPTIKSEYVRFVQQRLKNLGYSLSIDGSFGPDMDKKVKQFQKDRSLKVDGWIGKDTVEQLLK